jgi:hypothetical protein
MYVCLATIPLMFVLIAYFGSYGLIMMGLLVALMLSYYFRGNSITANRNASDP